jgi:hypothetical protein
MLPVLSADGTLEFGDAAGVAAACEQLRRGGAFEVQAQGTPGTGLVRLRIRLPGAHVPIVHTAAVRPGAPGRMLVGMSGAGSVIARFEAVAREQATAEVSPPGPTARHAGRPTTPQPAAVPSVTPSRPTGPRVVVSLADLDAPPPLDDPPVVRPVQRPAAPPPVAQRPAVPAGLPPAAAAPRPAEPVRPRARPSPGPPPAAPAARPATPAPPPAPAARIELQGALVRQPHAKDLRTLFAGSVDKATLAATHLGDLLCFLTRSGATGRLRLVGPRTKTFWLCEGDLGLSEADPPRPEESIGHLVVKMGRLSSAAPVEEAVAIAGRTRRRTGDVLVERGLLEPSHLPHLLRTQTEARLLHAADWSAGEYEFTSVTPPSTEPKLSALRAHVALARHVVGRATAPELQARFEAVQQRYARLAPMADVEEQALLGDARAAHTLRHAFPGTHRLKEALPSCPLGKVPTLRLLVLLDAYGVLETDTAPLVLAHGADPAGALRHRALQAKGQDPFRRLGAHAAMPPDQIRECYARVMADCSPGGLWERFDADAASLMAGLVDEAFRALHDPESRARCRRESLGPARARYVAELLCAHALVLRGRGQPQPARAVAEVALELYDCPEARELAASQ